MGENEQAKVELKKKEYDRRIENRKSDKTERISGLPVRSFQSLCQFLGNWNFSRTGRFNEVNLGINKHILCTFGSP